MVACATSLGLCEGQAQVWTTATVPGELRLVLPFASGNVLAAVGPYHTYFLNAQTGAILNLGGKAIAPSGSQVIVGVQPGLGGDFYVLAGPDLGATATAHPTEIIAVDSPSSGELWRLQYGSGTQAGAAMYIGMDDIGQPWIRAGNDLLELWSTLEYRNARGPTPSP